MKILNKAVYASVFLVLGAAFTAPALAHGVRFGVNIGVPLFPYYYPSPYYYPAPVAVPVPAPAPVYIEQRETQMAPAPAEQWWYYCPDSKTYYPYVQQCANPWQRVSPQPPGT